jgi:hypothetical protein
MCFGQPCGHLHGYKIQKLDTLKYATDLQRNIKISEPIQMCNYNNYADM